MKYLVTTAIAVAVFAVGYLIVPPVQNIVNQQPGAATGPDSFFDCETHNGVQRCFYRMAMTTGTTTPCAFKMQGATSTLVIAQARLNVATATAATVTIAKSTSFNATTTLLASGLLAAGAQGTVVATTTGGVDTASVIAPNNYIVFGISGGQGGITLSSANSGVCLATTDTTI